MADQGNVGIERTNSVADSYAEIFQHASEAILLLDPAGDRILEANHKACRLLGCSRDALLGTPV